MNAVGCSTGSSEPTRSRQRPAPPTVPSATRPARWRRGCSSRRSLDRDLLPLPSRHHSTVPPSLKRNEVRYEEVGFRNTPRFYSGQTPLLYDRNGIQMRGGVRYNESVSIKR